MIIFFYHLLRSMHFYFEHDYLRRKNQSSTEKSNGNAIRVTKRRVFYVKTQSTLTNITCLFLVIIGNYMDLIAACYNVSFYSQRMQES
jgi:hypothetical protein